MLRRFNVKQKRHHTSSGRHAISNRSLRFSYSFAGGRFPHFERVINALKLRRDVVGFRLHSDYQWRRSPTMCLDLYLQSAIDATFLLSSVETSVQAQFAIQNVIE